MTNLNAIAQKDGLVIAVGDDSQIWHIDYAADNGQERITAPPRPAGCALRAVAIRHRTDAWAVGEAGVVLRWDGASWHHVQAGLAADCLLEAICLTQTDVWIGGRRTLLRWSRNAALPAPTGIPANVTVHALHAPTPQTVCCLCARRLLGSWDGARWSVQPLPGQAEHEFFGLGGPPQSPADLWACGTEGALLHYDGSAWRAVPPEALATPKIPKLDDILLGLCCPAPGQVYLVSGEGALLHWDGISLQVRAMSPLGGLSGVCMVAEQVLAAGAGGVMRCEPPAAGAGPGGILHRFTFTTADLLPGLRWSAEDWREVDREVLLAGRERGQREGREQGALEVLHRIYVERFGRGPEWWPGGLGARELPAEVVPVFLRCTQEEIARACGADSLGSVGLHDRSAVLLGPGH